MVPYLVDMLPGMQEELRLTEQAAGEVEEPGIQMVQGLALEELEPLELVILVELEVALLLGAEIMLAEELEELEHLMEVQGALEESEQGVIKPIVELLQVEEQEMTEELARRTEMDQQAPGPTGPEECSFL